MFGECVSACEEIGKPFFVVRVNVGVEDFLCEECAWNCVEGLAYVYCGEECAVCGFWCVEAFEYVLG